MAVLGKSVDTPPVQPVITVHLHVTDPTAESAAVAIKSLLKQSWPHWKLFVTTAKAEMQRIAQALPADARIVHLPADCASGFAGLSAALRAASTRYLIPLAHDCRFPNDALLAYAAQMERAGADDDAVIYADQIENSASDTNRRPWFKPDWDFDMFIAQDYLTMACGLPVAAARKALSAIVGDPADCAAVYAVLVNLAMNPQQRFTHLRRVAVETPPDHWKRPCPARIAVLRQALIREYEVDLSDGPFGTVKVDWPLPVAQPLVSIVIPTRDKVDLLRPCVEGVLEQTNYRNFEIIIADNGSVERSTKEFLEEIADDPRVTVVSWPHPYNYSAINNFAVRESRGQYVCLLNNDIEIIDGDWLTEMMRHACRDNVGAVGARLLYPDGSIQHAGVAVGLGNAAGHAHRGLHQGEAGYFAHSLIARGATAVTAACLVVSRRWFDTVGGLDEESLKIAYNDVDFCLKLVRAGARNIYVPTAVLIHLESKSRGLDMAPQHLERYLSELAVLQKRWHTETFCDPTHHPQLDRSSETYRPAYDLQAREA